jgi:hypothetical protein
MNANEREFTRIPSSYAKASADGVIFVSATGKLNRFISSLR